MLCEIRNTAIRVGGKRYPIGTIKEFDSKLVKEYPNILFPVGEIKSVDDGMKQKVLKLQKENEQLNSENVKLTYAIEDHKKTIDRLTKRINEYMEKIKLLSRKKTTKNLEKTKEKK